MAKTNFSLLLDHQKKSWAMETWHHARNQSYINRFVGSGQNSMIQRVTELKASAKGTRAVITLTADMETDGITADNLLEGNEEALKAFDFEVTMDQLRNANRLEGRMADQKTIVDFRKTSRDVLAYWLADRMDQMAFLSLSSVPYARTNTGGNRPARPAGQNLSELAFAPEQLGAAFTAPSAARAYHLTASGINSGSGYNATPGALVPLSYKAIVQAQALAHDRYLKGLRTGNGEGVFHMFVTPQGMAELKLDPDFIANVRHAGARGTSNPLFAGTATSVLVDGLMIHEYRHVFNTRDAASGSKFGTTGLDNGQRVLICGAQALAMADIGPGYWDEDSFDYNNQPGISYGKIFGFTKTMFKGNPMTPATKEDFGVITLDTGCTFV